MSSHNPDWTLIPEHLRPGLQRYIVDHLRPGGFLTAVLSNDLKESFARADETSRAAMSDIVSFLYNDAPAPCWGSPAKVEAWLANHPAEGPTP